MDTIIPMIVEYHEANARSKTKVIEYLSPKDLQKVIDFSVGEKCSSLKIIIDLIKQVLRYSVRTTHPRFFKMLYTGTDPIGWVSELITAVTNTNCHIYTAAPCFAIMEKVLIQSLGTLLGFDPKTVDGIFCPGGTASNITGFMVAKNIMFPHVKLEGWKP